MKEFLQQIFSSAPTPNKLPQSLQSALAEQKDPEYLTKTTKIYEFSLEYCEDDEDTMDAIVTYLVKYISEKNNEHYNYAERFLNKKIAEQDGFSNLSKEVKENIINKKYIINNKEFKSVLNNVISAYGSFKSTMSYKDEATIIEKEKIMEERLIKYIEKPTPDSLKPCKQGMRELTGEQDEGYENTKDTEENPEQKLEAEKSQAKLKEEKSKIEAHISTFSLIISENPLINDMKEFVNYSKEFKEYTVKKDTDGMNDTLKTLKKFVKSKNKIMKKFNELKEFALPEEKVVAHNYSENFLNPAKKQEVNGILERLTQRKANPLRLSLPKDFNTLKAQLTPLYSEKETGGIEQKFNNEINIFEFESAKITIEKLKSEFERRRLQHATLSLELSKEISLLNEKFQNYLNAPELKSDEYKEMGSFLEAASRYDQSFKILQENPQESIKEMKEKINNLKDLHQEFEAEESKKLAIINKKIMENIDFIISGYSLDAKKCCSSITQLPGTDEKDIQCIRNITDKSRELTEKLQIYRNTSREISQGNQNLLEKTKLLLKLDKEIRIIENDVRLLKNNTQIAIHKCKQVCFGHVKLIMATTLYEIGERIEKYAEKLKNGGIESTQKKYDAAFLLRKQMLIFEGGIKDQENSAQLLASEAKKIKENNEPHPGNLMLNVEKIKKSFSEINPAPFKKAASTGKVFDYMTTNDQNFFNTFEKNMREVKREIEKLSQIQFFC